MVALKRAFGVGLLGAGGQPGGIGAGAPEPDYFDDILASLSSAFNFSWRSGKLVRQKLTLVLDLELLGCPRFLGGSAGPRLLPGMWPRLSFRSSDTLDGPAADGSLTDDEDDDG